MRVQVRKEGEIPLMLLGRRVASNGRKKTRCTEASNVRRRVCKQGRKKGERPLMLLGRRVATRKINEMHERRVQASEGKDGAEIEREMRVKGKERRGTETRDNDREI